MTAYGVLLLTVCICSAEHRFKFAPKKHNGHYLSLRDLGPPRHQSMLYQHFQASLHEFKGSSFSSSSSSVVTLSTDTEPAASLSANTSNPLIYVTDFGADPTGQSDSTSAFQKAIARALSYGSPSSNLSSGIHDCGGATIDLAGGDYLISSPLLIPQYYGNLRLVDGTIRASAAFTPSSSYLLIIGDNQQACSNSQGSCNENIGVENMMFDCKQICYGAISIMATMGTVLGPQLFFLGFNGAGVTVNGGHETMIFTAWFGEFLYSDSRKENGAASTATGIQLFGNDHYVSNTIVFSSHIGVHITHPANILQGVHTWNLAVANNGTGILVESAQTRLLGCYLDWNDLVLVAPIQDVSVEDGFFLGGGQYGGGTLVLRANQKASVISGLSVFDNQFNHGGTEESIIWVDTAFGEFSSVENMRVDNNLLQNGFVQKSTRASKVLTLQLANEWKFDFSDVLLFESVPIQWLSYSVQIDDDSSFVQHTARKPVGQTVIVETSEKVNATVYVTVDQSQNFDY